MLSPGLEPYHKAIYFLLGFLLPPFPKAGTSTLPINVLHPLPSPLPLVGPAPGPFCHQPGTAPIQL